jgi:hypothetical protein
MVILCKAAKESTAGFHCPDSCRPSIGAESEESGYCSCGYGDFSVASDSGQLGLAWGALDVITTEYRVRCGEYFRRPIGKELAGVQGASR